MGWPRFSAAAAGKEEVSAYPHSLANGVISPVLLALPARCWRATLLGLKPVGAL
jgi:hypothetical protein